MVGILYRRSDISIWIAMAVSASNRKIEIITESCYHPSMNSNQPTAGIVLAAGTSSRFGQPKQLLKIQDRTLLERVVEAALGSQLERVVVVLGHAFGESCRALSRHTGNPRLTIVENPDFLEGMSTSLQAGLKTLPHAFPSVMFLLGDQPLIGPKQIDLLLIKFRTSNKDICVPCRHGQRGNPTIFSRRFFGPILNIRGDVGARRIIDDHSDQVLLVEVDDPAFFTDIDSPRDFAMFNQLVPAER